MAVVYFLPSIVYGQLPQVRYYFAIENLDNGQVIRRGKFIRPGSPPGPLIITSSGRFRCWLLNAENRTIGFSEFTTPAAGQSFRIPQIPLAAPTCPDSDGDGLSDDAEFILNCDPLKKDTDGDGIEDGAALALGIEPNHASGSITGIIGSTETPGNALDVCAFNDIAIVADSERGISVFNVFNRMAPLIIAQVDTPGTAQRVSCSGNLIAVADGPAGLAVVDITDPPAARITQQVAWGADATAVATAAGIAYVGVNPGYVFTVDLASGTVLERLPVAGSVQDLALGGDFLYVLTADRLYVVGGLDGALQNLGSAPSPFTTTPNRRLFVGGGIAYAVHGSGCNTFNLTNGVLPVLIQAGRTPQFGWKQLVPNGSGLAAGAVDNNFALDGPNDISVYDVSPAADVIQFRTAIQTPGIAFAVSIYNGLAYVADGASGLQVVNYRETDVNGQPPTVTLAASFPITNGTNGVVEEGKLVRVTASVSDDVQVRNVEFYIDGIKVATDGNFPFEHRFAAPSIRPGRPSFRLRARASDTGGNFTFSDEIVVTLTPDATGPRVVRKFPSAGAIVGALNTVAAYFNEPINTNTLGPATFEVLFAGSDGVLGTGDDRVVTGGALSYRDELNAAFVNFTTNQTPGLYQATVHRPLADLNGNVIQRDTGWLFYVLGWQDSDQDGLPDEMEIALGLNPTNAFSRTPGVLDGDLDLDGDGLRTRWELRWGLNPTNAFTGGTNGLRDDALDPDFDGLTNGWEQVLGTNPLSADSDGDGWDDHTEVVDELTDPLNRYSGPHVHVATVTASYLNAARQPILAGTAFATFSRLASYLNAVPEPGATNIFLVSPLVSYSNAPPAAAPLLNKR